MSTERPALYFGCGEEAGYYLHTPGPRPIRYGVPLELRELDKFDTAFAPHPEREDLLYVAAYFRLDGWRYAGLSWWDRTVDKRGKCNSIFFCPMVLAEPISLLASLKHHFPWVVARLPRPLTLWIPGAV